jgi:hypothetical protein
MNYKGIPMSVTEGDLYNAAHTCFENLTPQQRLELKNLDPTRFVTYPYSAIKGLSSSVRFLRKPNGSLSASAMVFHTTIIQED